MPFAHGDERIPLLHAVTNDEIVLRADFLERARRVMHAGNSRVAVHVRAPRLGAHDLYEIACRVAQLQHETGAWAIVNDRTDVAVTSGARGVQLTSQSISVAEAREIAPTLAIGASVHSRDDARSAQAGGAHWVVVSHAVDTEPHESGDEGGAATFIQQLVVDRSLPIIAIGGVKPEHVASLRAAGAYGFAVIRGVWNATDAGAAVIDYLSAMAPPEIGR